MKHFPVFLAVEGRRIVVSGGGGAALAKLRLLLKTEARLTVLAADPVPEIEAWSVAGRLTLIRRTMEPGDALCAALFYAANEDEAEDGRVAALARRDGAPVNVVDNLNDSQFITPAIVDRDPMTIAVGTEGAAPVLARKIKADLEAELPPILGHLARIGKAFRSRLEVLPMGRKRRDFWADYYFKVGPPAFEKRGEEGAREALEALLRSYLGTGTRRGRVMFVGAGPGDPELLTLKARKALDEADVVVHDRLVAPELLELARREATIINAGKEGFGPSMAQADINALIVRHARKGAQVVRLKSGDPTVFGRLDEEIEACDGSDIPWIIVPGITAASAAAAGIGQSLTRRGRNTSVRLVTGHDMKGFAEHDWRTLAGKGQVAAIYMGKKSLRFLQGRLLMHGADPVTPASVIENVSRPDQFVLATTLGQLADAVTAADINGPALILFGLAPRKAVTLAAEITHMQKEIAL